MTRLRSSLALSVLIAALAVPGTAAADLSAAETVNLDTYQPASIGHAGPVNTSESLTAGRFYVAEVTGTFSVYQADLWASKIPHVVVCGTPQAYPMFPSPGRPDSPAGQDAAFVFAQPWRGNCPVALPYRYRSFQIDTGSGFSHRTATNLGSAPATDHRYTYLLEGQDAVARFRQRDTTTSDNVGVLSIVVAPAVLADCAGDAACVASFPPGAPLQGSQPSGGVAGFERSVDLPSARRCLSRRRFPIRIRLFRKNPVVAASVRVAGKRVQVRRKRIRGVRRLVATVDLRGIERKVVRVRITARRKNGRVMVGTRRYQTCFPRRNGGIPRL